MHTDTPNANIDYSEVEKFRGDERRWWDSEGEFRTLHQINPLRVGYINERTPVSGRRVIDVGCGGGILSEALAEQGAQVTGIDAGDAIEAAIEHLQTSQSSIEYVKSTAEHFSSTHKEAFDIVVCMEVVEHVPDPASLVSACASLCKVGGSVYFSTLNRTLKSFVLGIVGAEYVLNMLPRGTHRYDKFIRPSELNRWCHASGLMMQDLTGLHYNPMTGLFRLGPGVDVNYFAHCKRL